LLTTPITLLALLKAFAYNWQQHHETENARQIAFQGKQLYKRLAAFLGNLSLLGRGLDQILMDYNEAVESLESPVLPMVRELKETGVSGRGLPQATAIVNQAIPPSWPARSKKK
jgi:DNA recombination protein RmuC